MPVYKTKVKHFVLERRALFRALRDVCENSPARLYFQMRIAAKLFFQAGSQSDVGDEKSTDCQRDSGKGMVPAAAKLCFKAQI